MRQTSLQKRMGNTSSIQPHAVRRSLSWCKCQREQLGSSRICFTRHHHIVAGVEGPYPEMRGDNMLSACYGILQERRISFLLN